MALKDPSTSVVDPRPLLPYPTTAIYLVRLMTYDQQALFGSVVDGQPCLNGLGQVAADEWQRSAHEIRGIQLDSWEITAHQLQGIVIMGGTTNPHNYSAPPSGKPRLLSAFVAAYKAAVAKRVNLLRACPGSPVWQRSYQEQPILDLETLHRVRAMLGHQS